MRVVRYEKIALRVLAKMPVPTAVRIKQKVAAFAENPASQAGNYKLMRGEDGIGRLRVGDWRVIMRGDAEVLSVMKIGTRGDIDKDFDHD
jgi:mRNA interferase RelE/StbE